MEIEELAEPHQEKKKKCVPVSATQPADSGNHFAGEGGILLSLERPEPWGSGVSVLSQADRAIVLMHWTITSDERSVGFCLYFVLLNQEEKNDLPFI